MAVDGPGGRPVRRFGASAGNYGNDDEYGCDSSDLGDRAGHIGARSPFSDAVSDVPIRPPAWCASALAHGAIMRLAESRRRNPLPLRHIEVTSHGAS
jgi:hypothetical protein